MKIRSKIIAVVLPIIFVTLGLSGISAYFSATSGITRIANDLLSFKVKNLEKQAESQWNLLKEYNSTDKPDLVDATKNGVAAYAVGIHRVMSVMHEILFPPASIATRAGIKPVKAAS